MFSSRLKIFIVVVIIANFNLIGNNAAQFPQINNRQVLNLNMNPASYHAGFFGNNAVVTSRATASMPLYQPINAAPHVYYNAPYGYAGLVNMRVDPSRAHIGHKGYFPASSNLHRNPQQQVFDLPVQKNMSPFMFSQQNDQYQPIRQTYQPVQNINSFLPIHQNGQYQPVLKTQQQSQRKPSTSAHELKPNHQSTLHNYKNSSAVPPNHQQTFAPVPQAIAVIPQKIHPQTSGSQTVLKPSGPQMIAPVRITSAPQTFQTFPPVPSPSGPQTFSHVPQPSDSKAFAPVPPHITGEQKLAPVPQPSNSQTFAPQLSGPQTLALARPTTGSQKFAFVPPISGPLIISLTSQPYTYQVLDAAISAAHQTMLDTRPTHTVVIYPDSPLYVEHSSKDKVQDPTQLIDIR